VNRQETAFAKFRPKEPHWYLAQLGSEPAARGRGAGGAPVCWAMWREPR
jgi:hypothetical protein